MPFNWDIRRSAGIFQSRRSREGSPPLGGSPMTENVFDCLSIRPAANRRRANRTIVDPRRVACRHKASTGEARHLLAPAVESASAQALLANESRLFEMIATGRPLSETL